MISFAPNPVGHVRQVKFRMFEFLAFVRELEAVIAADRAPDVTLHEPRDVADFIQALGIPAQELELIAIVTGWQSRAWRDSQPQAARRVSVAKQPLPAIVCHRRRPAQLVVCSMPQGQGQFQRHRHRVGWRFEEAAFQAVGGRALRAALFADDSNRSAPGHRQARHHFDAGGCACTGALASLLTRAGAGVC
jgi:hypothetical protein